MVTDSFRSLRDPSRGGGEHFAHAGDPFPIAEWFQPRLFDPILRWRQGTGGRHPTALA